MPSKIFIVPYRDRPADKARFLEVMPKLLVGETDPYEIYFAHQYDARPFNRGAMKNIGFLAMKAKYPATYKDITFIFHDVDTYPVEPGLIDYTTTAGVVKHYYGYKFALGGIFAIKGADFEKCQGFPNFWGWGLEDNTIQDRCLAAGLKIDRSCFYDINDRRIVRSFDGFKRIISKRDSLVYKHETPDNLYSLTKVSWLAITGEFIHITYFEGSMKPQDQIYQPIDIRHTTKLIVPKSYEFRRGWKMFK
jgi:hypothetical protein